MTAGRPIDVLVVDDSVVIRRMVTSALSEDPAIRVVGSASSGQDALDKIPVLAPDILTLDIEMPGMDGLETLRRLRRAYPALPVIMFSTATEHAAAATFDALSLGARDYVTKPANVGSVTAALAAIREQLIPKLKALVPHAGGDAAKPMLPPPTPLSPPRRPTWGAGGISRARPHELLAIGASTGGPDALAAMLAALPADFPVPVVVTQHMPPMFTRLFAERLDRRGPLRVVEGCSGLRLEPGMVVVAPGDHHLVVRRIAGSLQVVLSSAPPRNYCRPAADVMFASIADVVRDRTLACVLTGMGRDGLAGCRRLRAAGAEIVVQDEQTSVVWGMPGAVVGAGLADRVLPLPRIAADLTAAVRRGRPVVPLAAAALP